MKKRMTWIAIGLLLAATAYAGWAMRGDGGRAELARELEAAKAEAAELIVAKEATERELNATLADQDGLRAEIDRMAEALGARPRVREVTRWQTDRIEVPVDRIVPGSCPPPDDDPADTGTPSVTLQARGAEARLVSEAGNTFATGTVELWRIEPPPPELLGTAPWSAPLTSLMVATEKRPTPWRAIATLGATSDEQVEAGLVWHRHSRVGWYARAMYRLDPESVYQPSSEGYISGDEWAVGAGVALTLGRR